jgi:hypothetical protein
MRVVPSQRGSPKEFTCAGYRFWVAVALVLIAGLPGCARNRYRLQADAQTLGVVAEKAVGPKWRLPPQQVYRGPESRMHDVTNPNRPAMPPDDPAAHRLMHYVDGKRGYPHWHRNGDVPFVDAQKWRQYLPYDEEGRVLLSKESAVQLALIHSRDYQFEVEDLYLSALDVTLQRFQFDTQFFSTSTTQFTNDGKNRPGGAGLPNSELRNDSTLLQVKKTTAIGTSAVVGLANSIIWQFAGHESETAFTLLNFNIVQPLLRFGTRVRVLEQLTQSERTLLSNVRQLDQYRQGFYNSILTGRAPGDGATRGAGLNGVGSGGLGVTSSTGTGTVGGYYGLLQTLQQIRNQKFNITGLRDSLAQLQELYDAGRIPNPLQVEQARQALYSGQTTLITNIAAYETRLDAFKVQLGLPPDLKVEVKDDLLDPFLLIDDSMNELQDRVEDKLDVARQLRADPQRDELAQVLDQALAFRQRAEAEMKRTQDDVEKAFQQLGPRREQLKALTSRPEIAAGYVDTLPYSAEQLDQRLERLRLNAERLTETLDVNWQQLVALRESLDTLPLSKANEQAVELLTQLSSQLLEISLAQAGARLETVTLIPVELTSEEALEIARQNRRDWMNARTTLIDNWRQIEYTANALRSGLNVNFNGDLRTTGDNPFKFNSTTGRLQVAVAFDAPLTRLLERNNFREALIDYQRARRNYMLFEDRINQGLRATLRILRLIQLNFEMRRAAVVVAVKQVDLARERLREPPRAAAAAGASSLSPTTARDLVSALSDLLNAQNDFLGQWVNYEALRMSLDFELGTMRLDDQGRWLDPGKIDASHGRSNDFCEFPNGFNEWPDVPSEVLPPPPGEAKTEELPVPPKPADPGERPKPRDANDQ